LTFTTLLPDFHLRAARLDELEHDTAQAFVLALSNWEKKGAQQ
jgi:hypothetical protein